jgi:hypothetical protein
MDEEDRLQRKLQDAVTAMLEKVRFMKFFLLNAFYHSIDRKGHVTTFANYYSQENH